MINTTNPHCFTYKTDELLIELLGGIRIDGLDRMRVTIKVTVVNRKHAGYLTNPELAGLYTRHNLDLYNDTQVEKFVRRVTEKLETDNIAISFPGELAPSRHSKSRKLAEGLVGGIIWSYFKSTKVFLISGFS